MHPKESLVGRIADNVPGGGMVDGPCGLKARLGKDKAVGKGY